MTNQTRVSVFAPRLNDVARTGSALEVIHTKDDATAIVNAAQKVGGVVAGWRARRAISRETGHLLAEGLKAHFRAKHEELLFRTALALDSAKKRAIADSIADTSLIEREIAHITSQIIVDLMAHVGDTRESAAFEEVRRIERLEQALTKRQITEARFHKEVDAVTRRADDIADKAEAVAQRVIENIGERLAAALRVDGIRDG